MQDERFIPYFQLCQWKAAVKLESLGMKHSSGRSVTALVKKTFGLPRSTTRDAIIAMLQGYIDELQAQMESA